MVFKGFRFGMILQLAIGPICIFIFQVAITQGFFVAEAGVLGTALTDGLEIALAIFGVGTLLARHKGAKRFLRIFGAIILFLYGLNSIFSIFNITVLPNLTLDVMESSDVFVYSVVLALSNPLTIVFWAGIFATKIVEENMQKCDLKYFGLGCILSTLLFLSLVSFVGSITKQVIPLSVIRFLNFAVGILLIYFGIKNILAKDKDLASYTQTN